YKSEGNDEKMVKVWKNYVNKYGTERTIARSLSRYFMEHERYDEAIEQLEALEGYEKDNLNVKIQIALILIEQKKLGKAARQLEEIVEQGPELDKVRFYLAAVYEELGRSSEAVEEYVKLPSASSYFVDGVIHASHILKESGNSDKSLALVKAGLEKRDDAPQ